MTFVICSAINGWKMGFEPTTLGTTILYSNQLSYIHHIDLFPNRCANIRTFFYSPKFSEIIFSILYRHALCITVQKHTSII